MASTKNSSLLCKAVGGLFMEDRFSDVTIVCQEMTFKAHRAIICTQSCFFDAALKHGFKVRCSVSNSFSCLHIIFQGIHQRDHKPTRRRPGDHQTSPLLSLPADLQ